MADEFPYIDMEGWMVQVLWLFQNHRSYRARLPKSEKQEKYTVVLAMQDHLDIQEKMALLCRWLLITGTDT